MVKFTNPTPGARGILLKSGDYKLVEAGETVDLDEKDIADNGAHPDIVKGAAAAKAAAEDKPAS